MKKTKFTIIDALIILVIVAAAAVLVLKLKPADRAENGRVEFSVLVSNVDEGSSEIVGIGDEVLISYSEISYATVTGVEEKEYVESEFNESLGRYVSHPIAGKSEIKITAECEADISDTVIKNGQTPIRVGSAMPVRGKGYAFNGYVIELEEKEAAE